MSDVLYAAEDGVALITLNRPKSLNAMNDSLVRGLLDAVGRAGADPEVRSVVLTGEGRAFCAGGDLSFLQSLTDPAMQSDFIAQVGRAALRLTEIPKPVIAMVQGTAAGAGVNLMLACDLIYASESARFTEAFAKVGLMPDCGGLYFLRRAVGLQRARELIYTGDIIDATQAERWGLVTRIFPADELREKTFAMARRLASGAPLALSAMKRYSGDESLSLRDVLRLEAEEQPRLMRSRDCREGIEAFYQKRAPIFRGE